VRIIVFFAVVAILLFGQSESASLTGTLTDPSGAVIKDVRLAARNEATGVTTEAVTNEEGLFSFPVLRPGVYTLSANAPGFKQLQRTGITLQVNQAARLDLRLELGSAAETVSVTADVTLLETETSGRGAVIDTRKIVELPLNGRDYNQLALLSPGVLAPSPRLQSIEFKGAFNVNGNRAFQNAFLLDGVDNTSYSNSFRGGNMQVVQPSIDALQEFKIQTNAYSAEFGRSSGALINAVIKSGGNQIHGSLYEFHRNRALDATNFFSNKTGAEKPFRLRNQFGGSLGGPIVANKTFFFGDYEGLRDRRGTVYSTTVPQPIWRQGLFARPIFNPFNPSDTGQDFRQPAMAGCNDGQGNCWVIPERLIDPVGRRVLEVNPHPNTGSAGQIDNNFVSVPITRTRADQFDVRLDHSLSTKVNLFGRYSFSDTNLFKPAPKPGLAEASTNDTFGFALWRSQAIAAGGTWVVSPSLLAELRFGWSRGDYDQKPPNTGSGCPEELIGLRGAPDDESLCGGLPVFDLPGPNSRRIGRTTSVPQFQTPRSFDYRGSVAWNNGSHAWKFGAELLHVQTGIRDVSTLLGQFNFTGRFSGTNNDYAAAIADLLMGFPTRYRQDSNTVFNQWQRMYFAFVQDDWKVTRRLSLNLGVRYEFATPPRERDNQWANFIPELNTFVAAKDGSLFDRALIHPDWNNVAPRFGFSFQAHEKTVVRGAYGIFYNHTNRQGREGLLGFNYPFIIQFDRNIAGSNALKQGAEFFRLQEGIPAGLLDPNVVDTTALGRKAQDPNQRTPYVQQWNFGIQQELGGDLLFDAAYVGNRGLKLPAFRNLNQRPVTFNAQGVPTAGPRPLAPLAINGDNVQLLENLGVSNYHSLQLRIEKRFSAGISGLASYTWGKALTNSVDHLSTSGAGNGVDVGVFREPQNGYDRRPEYGPAEFDVTHRFIASAVWQLPYSATGAGVKRFFLGGWELAPIITVQTGLGLTVTQLEPFSLGGERRSRPNRIGDGSLPESERTVDRWLDASAFVPIQTNPAQPGFTPNQVFGNSGVGILRGPGLANVDLNASKNFAITERQRLQFRAEFFNLFNHSNFGVPGITLGAGFGQIIGTATEARVIQFALKYVF
jgi:hypothetical protein